MIQIISMNLKMMFKGRMIIIRVRIKTIIFKIMKQRSIFINRKNRGRILKISLIITLHLTLKEDLIYLFSPVFSKSSRLATIKK